MKLKFTHQTGKKDVYNFEVEVKDLELDPKEIVKNLDLTLDLPGTDADYWRRFNSEVNLNAKDMNDEDILGLIESYL